MAKQSIAEKCKIWGYEEWKEFNDPVYQASVLKNLSETEKNKVTMQQKLFWECYEGNRNPISESDKYADPEGGYEMFLEETRKEQEIFIKDRGSSFIFYSSFLEAVEDLNDRDFRTCITALLNYGLYRKKEEYKGIVKMFMAQAIPQMDANERKKQIARQNGMKGGAPENNQNAKKQPNST